MNIPKINQTNKNYTIPFNRQILNILNSIENELIRANTMSIYSYFMKLIKETESTEIMISLRNFIKRYTKYHKSICKTTLIERIQLLKTLGLLNVRKESRKTFYSIIDVTDKTTDKTTDKNPTSAPDISNVELDSEFCKAKISKPKGFIIYYNTAEEAVAVAKKVLSDLKVKSKWIINSTIAKVKEKYTTIGIKGAEAYIGVMINRLQQASKANYAIAKGIIKKKVKSSKFNGYTQRDINYYAKKEKELNDESNPFDDIQVITPSTKVSPVESLVSVTETDKFKLFMNVDTVTKSDFEILNSYDISILKKLAIDFYSKNGVVPSAIDILTKLNK